jgi:hypothetical protein
MTTEYRQKEIYKGIKRLIIDSETAQKKNRHKKSNP